MEVKEKRISSPVIKEKKSMLPNKGRRASRSAYILRFVINERRNSLFSHCTKAKNSLTIRSLYIFFLSIIVVEMLLIHCVLLGLSLPLLDEPFEEDHCDISALMQSLPLHLENHSPKIR